MAAIAFVAIFYFKVAFPLIIISAGLIGFIGGKFWKNKFLVIKGHAGKGDESVISDEAETLEHTRPSFKRMAQVLIISLLLWGIPVLGLGLWQGPESTFFREGIFFSKAAMVTFGGAYAVLSYVAQRAVEDFHWLTAGQ